MARRLLVALSLLVSVSSALSLRGSSAHSLGAASTANPLHGPFVVVLVIDGLRYDEIDLSRMPNLTHLMDTGATFDGAWVGQLPSVTETSHATLGTGMLPAHHLILGDTWRVPGTTTMSPNLLDQNLDRTGYIGKFIQQTKVPTLAGIVHSAMPGSLVVALSGHKTYAADAMGAGSADFVAMGSVDSRKHFVPSAIPGHAPSAEIMTSPQLDMATYPGKPGSEDAWATTLAEKFLFKYHPRVMLVNLPEVDTIGHVVGTSATVMQPLISNVDKQIGRLVKAYQRAGILSRTSFVITADHGMVPKVHSVDVGAITSIVQKKNIKILYGGHGDFSEIWLKNPARTSTAAGALVVANIPNVVAVYAANKAGHFTLASSPDLLPQPSVQSAYADLLASMRSAEAPDIVLFYRENTITMTPALLHINRLGDHKGATWGAQHIPLIINGPGIKQNFHSQFPARLVDVAPTVEALLGIKSKGQDGVPLADVMVAPPAWAVKDQNAVAARFTQDVTALEASAVAQQPQSILVERTGTREL